MKRLLQAFACAAVLVSGAAAHAQSATDGPRGGIAYASVAEAYDALHAKAGVTFSRNGDWTVANDTDRSIWSFTPSNHDAHPSVGRRQLLQHQGSFFVKTEILCQARKAACDRLHGDYQQLDQRMTEADRAGK
jgi:hypothetical protein